MKKRITLIATMLLVIALITGCGTKANLQKRIDSLSETVEDLKEENRRLKDGEKTQMCKDLESAIENGDIEDYLDIKFPEDGNIYRPDNIEVHFYTNPYCTILSEELPIISPAVDKIKVKEGSYAYCVRAMKDGETVMIYSFLCPNLQVVDYSDYDRYYDTN